MGDFRQTVFPWSLCPAHFLVPSGAYVPVLRLPSLPLCTGFYPTVCFRGSMKLSGGTIEWPKATSRRAKRRVGGLGPGVSLPVKFWNLRRNLVHSDAFLQEIDVCPVIHFCERKYLLLDSTTDIVTYYFNFLVVWMPSVSCCSRKLGCSGRVSWSPKQVLPLTGEVDGSSPGRSNFVSGWGSSQGGWINPCLRTF